LSTRKTPRYPSPTRMTLLFMMLFEVGVAFRWMIGFPG
jgi:hypothetical protein